MGYRASNRRDYEKQMVTWLQRREAVSRFGAYLDWALGLGMDTTDNGYDSDNGDEEEDEDEDDDEDEPGVDEHGDDRCDNAERIFLAGRTPYTVQKRTTTMVTINSLEQEFHAHHFLYYLQKFMDHNSLLAPTLLNAESKIKVWKQAKLTLRPIPTIAEEAPAYDMVHAFKRIPAKRERGELPKAEVPERFSTVLVRDDLEGLENSRNQTRGRNPFAHLRVARLRVIFRLSQKN
ncbi:hypothetical protein VNI00_019420 [Paramarasmius palmivorus]|uniref:Uncharacterized protein n=1 Tax=Paramarasmius palmivorus TaxID=297713 RepID=A0AAW0ALM5_9AGAR